MRDTCIFTRGDKFRLFLVASVSLLCVGQEPGHPSQQKFDIGSWALARHETTPVESF